MRTAFARAAFGYRETIVSLPSTADAYTLVDLRRGSHYFSSTTLTPIVVRVIELLNTQANSYVHG